MRQDQGPHNTGMNMTPQRNKKKMTLHAASGYAGDSLPQRKLFSENASPQKNNISINRNLQGRDNMHVISHGQPKVTTQHKRKVKSNQNILRRGLN